MHISRFLMEMYSFAICASSSSPSKFGPQETARGSALAYVPPPIEIALPFFPVAFSYAATRVLTKGVSSSTNRGVFTTTVSWKTSPSFLASDNISQDLFLLDNEYQR